jgi:AraC family transcriptional regulator
MARLAGLMLEQVFRVLTASNASGLHPRHVHFSRLQKVLRHINGHLTDALPSEQLARLAGVSESHFRRIFIDATGLPPHRYIQGRRLAQARKLLVTSELPIPVIADECGFYSQSHLTKGFKATHGTTPAAYRRQMKQVGP